MRAFTIQNNGTEALFVKIVDADLVVAFAAQVEPGGRVTVPPTGVPALDPGSAGAILKAVMKDAIALSRP